MRGFTRGHVACCRALCRCPRTGAAPLASSSSEHTLLKGVCPPPKASSFLQDSSPARNHSRRPQIIAGSKIPRRRSSSHALKPLRKTVFSCICKKTSKKSTCPRERYITLSVVFQPQRRSARLSARPAQPKPEPKAKKAAKKEKAVNDKKEDKKTKKAKENAEAEANEENHSENGEAKTNEARNPSEGGF
uniref:High mobility group nucleosome binding domain 6 n=1 Tax=Tetraodon nigroviridis TaxID=99883 RepID=H3DHI7_TETNG